METTERPVLVIGIDNNSHSFYALEWTLDHFFSPPKTKPFKLVIVYARPPPPSVIRFAGPGKAIVFSPFGSREKNGTKQNTGWKWVHFSQQPNEENVSSLKKKIKMLQKGWNDIILVQIWDNRNQKRLILKFNGFLHMPWNFEQIQIFTFMFIFIIIIMKIILK